MQLHHARPRAISKRRVAIEFTASCLVKVSDLTRVKAGRALLLHVEQVLEQHAERRAPITDVILTNYVVTPKCEHATQRVTDDRRTQMPRVHLLGDIGRPIVDHAHVTHFGFLHAERRLGQHFAERLGEHVVTQRQIDEAGTRDFDALVVTQVLQVQVSEQRLRNVTGRTTERLAQAHRHVDLVVRAVGAAEQRICIAVFGTEGLCEGRFEAVTQQELGVGRRAYYRPFPPTANLPAWRGSENRSACLLAVLRDSGGTA